MASETLRLLERPGYGGVAVRSSSSKGEDYWLFYINPDGELHLDGGIRGGGTNFNRDDHGHLRID